MKIISTTPSVNIVVNTNGEIFIEGRQIFDTAQLDETLRVAANKDPMPNIQITAGRKVGAKSIGKVIFCALNSGFTEKQLIFS
jgi:biopolymer transport protein ExbD